MAREFSSEYVQYMNEMGDLLSECDGTRYAFNDVAAMEKRLLQGKPPIKQPTPQVKPPAQPPTARPRSSRLGWIAAGFDVDD